MAVRRSFTGDVLINVIGNLVVMLAGVLTVRYLHVDSHTQPAGALLAVSVLSISIIALSYADRGVVALAVSVASGALVSGVVFMVPAVNTWIQDTPDTAVVAIAVGVIAALTGLVKAIASFLEPDQPASGPYRTGNLLMNCATNAFAVLIVILIVRFVGVQSETSSAGVLLVTGLVITAICASVGFPVSRAAFLANVAANAVANFVILFVPPANEWILSIPTVVFVAGAAMFVFLCTIVLVVMLDGSSDGPGCAVVTIAALALIGLVIVFVYNGFAVPEPGFSASNGWRAIWSTLKWTVVAGVGLFLLAILWIIESLSREGEDDIAGQLIGSLVLIALFIGCCCGFSRLTELL